MNTRIIIMAGGTSSRMKKSVGEIGLDSELAQQANNRNKGLISLGKTGRPMMDYLLANIQAAGFREVYIVTGSDSVLFQSRYAENRRFPKLKIRFATQHIPVGREKPLGTTDAVFQTLEQYPELQQGQFAVCNCDNLYSIRAFQEMYTISETNASIAYDRAQLEFPEERIARFAVMTFDENYYLRDIIEKPEPEHIENYQDTQGKIRVSMNLFAFDGGMMFPFLRDCPLHPERQEKELATAIMNMLKEHPKGMVGIPLAEHVPDLTSKEDILKMEEYVKKHFNKMAAPGIESDLLALYIQSTGH